MAAQIYTEKEASLAPLQGRVFGVIGFGSQGHAHALNLRDSGVEVIVGLPERSRSVRVAEELGFSVHRSAEVAERADLLFLAAPDLVIPDLYAAEIAPRLRPGQTLGFAHGFSVHYRTITPPENVDVIMVAPKGPGHIVRREFTQGKGVPALVAVAQNPSGKALANALAWAAGIGAARAGVIETTFREETETDLFGEQAVLCGGMTALVQAGFETLVEAGYQPEMAYFECLHEMKLIVDLMQEAGISGMRFSISETAKWGDVTVGPQIIDEHVRQTMRKVLGRIQDGSFAREWIAEARGGKKRYQELLQQGANHPIEQVGARMRSLMPWLKKRDVSGVQAAYERGGGKAE
ncbi:ketol-acid reductoisomerase [Methylacidimicrobium cyclopophantes]|uniref:Ketol-acid reductoisomerase (NADP(+)) n=1 Tax=Methylacidimicrobium cyclopophantes TaxID=1041766 RepID=A0A5E6M527_9BACT|nr:ketol-acid reductoisomerase [Methylacidimicrobium cyclopophantes]VVM04454.1 ketol-acid reductoisomerase [Methylacidimicrobium cyclopophantes]